MRHRGQSQVRLPIDGEYFISLFSGVESGLAITAGLIAGLVAGTNNQTLVISTAAVAIVVQAFNSAAVRLSEQRIQDVIDHSVIKDGIRKPLIDAVAVLCAHLLAGLCLLLPLIYTSALSTALMEVIAITFSLLLALGLVRIWLLKSRDPLAELAELVIIGGLVICVGLVSGFALNE